jgi:60 kDa SS-A/Ro ribonucleoprotein
MAKYADLMNAPTPVSKPIPGREKEMVKMRGGGHGFAIDKWTSLERFLILGTDANTYYADAKELTRENAVAVLECAREDHARTVNTIIDISTEGRAFRNDAAIFALALIAQELQHEIPAARQRALEAVPAVARTASFHFMFQDYMEALGGRWNPTRKEAVRRWYTSTSVDRLAYQTLKFRNRYGWTHRDLIKQGRFGTHEKERDALFQYLIYGKLNADTPELVHQYERIKVAENTQECIDLIRTFKLTWEFVPSEFLAKPEVWRVLLPNLPYTAMLRNIARMTANGTFDDSEARKLCARRLLDAGALKRQRVHPISILMATAVYKQGKGRRGSLTWQPLPIIADAMEEAFYEAFQYVEPSGKSFLIGLDVSSSMFGWGYGDSQGIADTGLNAAEAAAAMVMSVMRTERDYQIMAFSHQFVPVPWGRQATLGVILEKIRTMGFGATNCGLPIEWAMKQNQTYDTIMILTDNETNRGHHVPDLMRNYRQKTGIPARFITAAMVANNYSIADPADPLMLDIVGFDSAMPRLVSNFAKGDF